MFECKILNAVYFSRDPEWKAELLELNYVTIFTLHFIKKPKILIEIFIQLEKSLILYISFNIFTLKFKAISQPYVEVISVWGHKVYVKCSSTSADSYSRKYNKSGHFPPF